MTNRTTCIHGNYVFTCHECICNALDEEDRRELQYHKVFMLEQAKKQVRNKRVVAVTLAVLWLVILSSMLLIILKMNHVI